MRLLAATVLLGVVILGCAGARPGSVAAPPEAVVDVRAPTLAGLDEAGRAVLDRYLGSNPRWSMHEEARGDDVCRFAYRKEPSPGGPFDGPEGTLNVSLNGFYSRGDGDAYLQTRVLLALGCEYGFGNAPRELVRAAANAGPTQLRVLDGDFGALGGESYLVVEGGAGTRLEVYEQVKARARAFTAKAIADVDAEIAAALAAREELAVKGYVASLTPAAAIRSGAPTLEVEDGMQPGIYVVKAWANAGEPGRVWVRARYAGPVAGAAPIPDLEGVAIGDVLSKERMSARSGGAMGWGSVPTVLFPYETEVTVYEGGWSDSYLASFELVFQGKEGAERVLVTGSRTIAGWER